MTSLAKCIKPIFSLKIKIGRNNIFQHSLELFLPHYERPVSLIRHIILLVKTNFISLGAFCNCHKLSNFIIFKTWNALTIFLLFFHYVKPFLSTCNMLEIQSFREINFPRKQTNQLNNIPFESSHQSSFPQASEVVRSRCK